MVYAPARHPGTEGVRHPCGIVLRSLRTIRCDLGFRCKDIVVVLSLPFVFTADGHDSTNRTNRDK